MNVAIAVLLKPRLTFSQVAPFELLATLDRLTPEQVQQRAAAVVATAEAVPAGPPPAAPPIAPAGVPIIALAAHYIDYLQADWHAQYAQCIAWNVRLMP